MGAVLFITACSSDPGEQYAEPVSAQDQSSAPPNPATDGPGDDPTPGHDATYSSEATEDNGEEASDSSPAGESDPVAMEASEPESMSIPEIDAQSELMPLGIQDDGVIEVPPFESGSPAGWYTHGPTPGEIGPAVLLGHRNADDGGGPGIFADLPELEIGDSVDIAREDGSTASFTIYRTEQFAKDEFPTLDVYGNTDEAELRLITCDGFNPETRLLDDNYIVYATLDT